MHRSLRTFLNIFGASYMTWLCFYAGLFVIRSTTDLMSSAWCAFLVSVVAISYMWAYLLSAKSADDLDMQKKLAAMMSIGLLWLFGLIAVAVTMALSNPTLDERIVAGIVFLGALLALPWMYHRHKKIMAVYAYAAIRHLA